MGNSVCGRDKETLTFHRQRNKSDGQIEGEYLMRLQNFLRFVLLLALALNGLSSHANLFVRQNPQTPVNPDLLSKSWSGRWITVPNSSSYDYGVYTFRKSFDLQTKPSSLTPARPGNVCATRPINRCFTHMRGYFVEGPGGKVDGANYPWGWEKPEFDDSMWQPAQTDGRWSGAPHDAIDSPNRWLPVPRNIPLMEEKPLRLSALRQVSGAKVPLNFPQQVASFNIAANSKARLRLAQSYLTTAYPELTVSSTYR
jgi:hypothetical protein